MAEKYGRDKGDTVDCQIYGNTFDTHTGLGLGTVEHLGVGESPNRENMKVEDETRRVLEGYGEELQEILCESVGLDDKVKWFASSDASPCPACGSLPPSSTS